MMSATNSTPAGRNIPRRHNIEGAPFSIGQRVKITTLVDIETLDYLAIPPDEIEDTLIGQEGTLEHYDYDCGCGQIFPDQPMIGIRLADDTLIEFWPEELAAVA